MVMFRYSVFVWWIGLFIAICVLLDSTRHVTSCRMWSRFNKLVYVFVKPITCLCRHFFSLLATRDELSFEWTSTRKQNIVLLPGCGVGGGGMIFRLILRNALSKLCIFGKANIYKGMMMTVFDTPVVFCSSLPQHRLILPTSRWITQTEILRKENYTYLYVCSFCW